MPSIKTSHYHTGHGPYYKRALYYHDHDGSFLLDEAGDVAHDHADEEPHYLHIEDPPPRFLPPIDPFGAD